MSSFSINLSSNPAKRLSDIADGLLAAVAVSLPWSTSTTGVLLVIWLVVTTAMLETKSLKQIVTTSPGGFPVLLVLLAFIGMFWADVTWFERWTGVAAFLKLLLIPLLLIQFQKSKRANWIFGGYLISCIVLLLLSFTVALWPNFPLHISQEYGVPVKNAPTQCGEFVTCISGLIYLAHDSFTIRHWRWVAGFLMVILAMLSNIVFIANGRTALAVLFVLLLVFAAKRLSQRGILLLCAVGAMLGTLGWFASPYLRAHTEQIWTDYQEYESANARTSSGERIEFYKRSIEFISEAPFIGHGTGTIHSLFIKSSIGKTGAAGSATTNPHNQTFAVAIQLGLVGTIILWGMWIAHLRLFSGDGLIAWVGLVIVIQNIIGSLFNSHLFDFMQGWVYVIGIGVTGGIAMQNRLTAEFSNATQ
jgi:O-antigen ligase